MKRLLAAAVVTVASAVAAASQDVDPEIARHLESIKAIDNHAHVMGLNRAIDKGYDQLRCDELPVTPSGLPPQMLRFNPTLQAAVRTLYGLDMTDDLEPSIKKLQAVATNTREKNGGNHYAWVLDKAGIQTVLANRTTMAPELKAPQFLWVPYADALMFPLDNSALKVNPDRTASVLEFFLSLRELAQVLRPWLESMPARVMFGTDAGPFGPGMDWEETTVMGAQQFRKALALALTLMVSDGVVTKARAMQIANSVLRGNAAALYGLK